MKIKWESNNRVKAMADQGKIDGRNIIKRTTTAQFPAGAATVRMHKPNSPTPHVTIHIRGKSKQKKFQWGTYECADTCRINFGGGYDNTMCSNGNLDEDLSWNDVHNLVETVKKSMGMN